MTLSGRHAQSKDRMDDQTMPASHQDGTCFGVNIQLCMMQQDALLMAVAAAAAAAGNLSEPSSLDTPPGPQTD
jgi:hypothetical protein